MGLGRGRREARLAGGLVKPGVREWPRWAPLMIETLVALVALVALGGAGSGSQAPTVQAPTNRDQVSAT